MLTHHSQDRHDAAHLIELVHSGEQRLPRVHLHQDAPQRPHVDGGRVGQPKHHLRGPVEPRLYVRVHLFIGDGASRNDAGSAQGS